MQLIKEEPLREEPTKRELEEIEKMISDDGDYYDEDFDEFSIMEEDFNINEDYYGEN